MSFQFKELTLKNWLVYGDVTSITFDDHKDGQNIFVFHGRNGFGKTSLLRALEFVFHGDYSRDEIYKMWHDHAKENGSGELLVSLKFIFDGQMCQLTRRADFSSWGSTYKYEPSLQLIINGEDRAGQTEDLIEQIIPKDCQQFVFFDGAEITRYAQQQHERGVKEAIEQILGIPAVRNMRDDLEKLVDELEEEQETIILRMGVKKDLLRRKQEAKDELDAYEEKKQQIQERIRGIKQILSKLQQEEVQIQSFESDSKLLAEKRARKADYGDNLSRLDSQIQSLLREAPLYMLVQPLAQIVAEADAKQIPSPRKTTSTEKKRIIEEILQEGMCICGRETDDRTEQILSKLLQRLEATMGDSAELSGWVSRAEANDLSRVLNRVRSANTDGADLMRQRARVDQLILELETDIALLEEKLQGHENADIRDLYRQRSELETQLAVAQNELNTYQQQIETTLKRLGDIQRELDQLATSDSQGQGITQTLNTTRALYQAVTEYVDELVEIKRHEIEHLSKQIFLTITNKPNEYAGVYVKEDYTLQVYRHDNTTVENEQLSAGEKEVLAYSFITALNLSSINPAPFVMDTPFGHLDAGHRRGLLDSLPRLGVQVFLLATDRDLPEDERGRIQHCIAQEFVLDRDQQRALSRIREA